MKKIEVTYSTPGGVIWKIVPDEKANFLIVESRDSERRKTMLSTLNLSDNTFIYTLNQLPKPWWLRLIAVENNEIILQGYKESNSPEPKGYYVFDVYTGKLLRQNEEENYKTSLDDSIKSSSVFPQLYNEDNEYYKTIVVFLGKNNGYMAVGPIEYLEYRDIVVISFYIQEDKKMTNILLVLNEDGNSILMDKLIEGAEGVGLASFFICKNRLIYVKNKTAIAIAEII